jgi:predicted metal-dependent peptidase
MTQKDLALITEEVLGIIATIGPRKVKLTLRSWDVEGHGDVIARLGDVEYDYVGRGGTNMVAALEQIASNREKPDLVIVATDGYIMRPWPQQAVLACPVVVCLIGEQSASLNSLPEWISGFKGEQMQERSAR